jgi:hypothetical protein
VRKGWGDGTGKRNMKERKEGDKKVKECKEKVRKLF